MGTLGFLGQRLLYLAIQLWGIVTITFFLVHLLPGNPAEALAGQGASPTAIARIAQQLGLDKPLPEQYVIYLNNVVHGQLGDAIYTGHPVLSDLQQRVPATLELVTLSLLLAVVLGIPLGVYSALKQGGVISKVLFVYGMLTGALPDFWLGLIFVFVFFYVLGWAPPPLGRLGLLNPPPHVTGFFLLDSLLNRDPSTFVEALRYLALPTITLVIVAAGNIVKQARSSMEEIAQSDFVEYARACGLSERVILRYMLRNALAPVVTVIGITYSFLLGGAVLVETVFSWGGVGQYAVQSVTNSDYAPVTGFVLFAALLMSATYLIVDLIYAALDPRIQY